MMKATKATPERQIVLPAVKEEESLVPDERGRLTPAQMVDSKFVSLLRSSPLLVSHLQDSVRRRPA